MKDLKRKASSSDLEEHSVFKTSPKKSKLTIGAEGANHLRILENCNDEDHEIFLFQCPEKLDPKAFVNVRINVGQKNQIDVLETGETYCVNIDPCNSFVNCIVDNTIRSLPLSGEILPLRKVHSKKLRKFEDESFDVPYPSNIRSRHPLLGAHWKDHIDKVRRNVKKLKKLKKIK